MLESIKVGSKTNASSLAGAIANSIRVNKKTNITCVGAQAVYQAARGLALAQKFLEQDHLEIFAQYEVEHRQIDEEESEPKVIICISVTSRPLAE